MTTSGLRARNLYVFPWILVVAASLVTTACSDVESVPVGDRPRSVYELASSCVSLHTNTAQGERYLATDVDGKHYSFAAASADNGAHFFAKASDLETYLLRDPKGGYVLAEDSKIARATKLQSDTLLNDDTFISPAEWMVEASRTDSRRFRLKNRATGAYLSATGLTTSEAEAAEIGMTETSGCADFPELGVDAKGSVKRTHFDDGDLFGIVDAHSHMFTNFGFGGGGVFHGSPFHRLGVEHALPDCSPFHGDEGRRDLLGYFYGAKSFDIDTAVAALTFGEIPVFDHFTAGYPDFTDWPNARGSYTHQTQYYRWLERSYLAGLRLVVQHATSNQILCELVTGVHAQEQRYSCNEMVSAERSIDETYALERYIDAQSGGPGKGWFRVVTTPAQAREVIGQGKLAVILGIETSNLFDCFLTTPAGFKRCDETYVKERLEHIHARGVRALFPVHKFDNEFSAGDGNRGFIELGNVLSSGHYSNFTLDCDPEITAVFDHGNVMYGGFNQPRDVYDSPAPIDVSGFAKAPAATILPYTSKISEPGLEGEYCQNAGLTPLGETLITEMMSRGMILEIDHLPKRSYARALELLVENDYPPAATHGSNAHGLVYKLGGISAMGLPRCGDANAPLEASASVRSRIEEIAAQGAYPAQGFGFDLNGFAGSARPRFGDESSCNTPQENPVTYPFMSYAGDVELEQPRLGNRVVDFNNEGMVHIGMMPELIEDARHVGVSDKDLEPLFRSAEGYIRMWERAEKRGAAVKAAK